MRLTAQLHVRTLGAQAEYDAVRQAVEPRHERVRIENARYLLDNAGRLRRWAEEVGAEVAPGTQEDLEHLARTLADPGPFLAFTHGDMAPSNTLFTREGSHLVDFEYGGMRHALYDALMWLLIVPLPGGAHLPRGHHLPHRPGAGLRGGTDGLGLRARPRRAWPPRAP